VSWYDAARFTNWLHNGQGAAETESGAYTLLGGSSIPSNGTTVTRNPGSGVFIASRNEWYKAAYYQPASAGGDSDSYWSYPTRTNSATTSDQPPGDPSIETNVANIDQDDGLPNGYNDGFAVTGSTVNSSMQNYLTDVGAYTHASSYYGTFDQGGNAWEWNDSLTSTQREIRGGSWLNDSNSLRPSNFSQLAGSSETNAVGFRVVDVPEPAMGAVVLAIAVFQRNRRRFGRDKSEQGHS
jgi:formylglycine-generating enzyme required for sulfatase activity